MTGQHIHLGQIIAGHVVDRVGQHILAVEAGAGVVAVGGIIHGIAGDINVFIPHQPIAAVAVHNHAVLVQAGCFQIIPIQEGRLQVRIHRLHLDVIRQGGVPVQQSGNGIIFIARNGQQVQGHILIQGRHDPLGLLRQGIQGVGCQVDFRCGAGQAADQHIGNDSDDNHNHCRQGGPAAGYKALAEKLLQPRLFLCIAHSFHLRFSMDCTVRNRNTQIMEM